jgi:hypothetical protein
MTDRQASIYVISTTPHWPTTVLGEIASTIRGTVLTWCWAANYTQPWNLDPTHDGVPDAHKIPMNGADHGFFVKLRYRCDAPGLFEGQLAQVARSHGWHVAFADYDLVDDLGKDRFIAAEQLSANSATSSQTLRGQRAERVAQFLYQTLLLAMDALVRVGPAGASRITRTRRTRPAARSSRSCISCAT